jgi:hypothetical protein
VSRPSDRAVLWIAFGFGLLVAAFGGLVWLAGGGRDAGGALGGAFLPGGLFLAVLAFPRS